MIQLDRTNEKKKKIYNKGDTRDQMRRVEFRIMPGACQTWGFSRAVVSTERRGKNWRTTV
jgi:hypothetical protein